MHWLQGSASVMKVGMVCMGMHISKCLKQELDFAIDEQIGVISTVFLKTVIPKVLSVKQYCMYCYVFLSNIIYIL